MTTAVERECYWHQSVPQERRDADVAAADGVLSTEHESGVAHVHQLLLGVLRGATAPNGPSRTDGATS